MAACPSCQTALPDDFGLVECPSCHKVIFMELDGGVTAMGDEEKVEPLPTLELAPSPQEEATPDLDFLADEPPVTTQPEVTAELMAEPEPNDMQDFVFDEALAPVSAAPEAPVLDESQNSLDQMVNTDGFSGRDGNLRYSVLISGVDTVDLREDLMEALSDRKLLLDADTLVRGIRNGELQIRDLSAVKASILVFYLRALPVQVSWEQHGS